MTTIQDTLTYADGSTANGRLVVTWKPFTVGNVNAGGGQVESEIVSGVVYLKLYSNLDASPIGSYYTAKYELENGAVYIEQWIVPNLDTVNLGQVRVYFPPTPTVMISPLQLTAGGAGSGQFLMWTGTHWVPGNPTLVNFTPNTIGLGVGKAGADVAVAGSPAVLGQSMTINIPDAGPAARGVVTTAAQTFAGAKTFSSSVAVTGNVNITGQYLVNGVPFSPGVPVTRQVTGLPTIGGGGPLSADLLLYVVPDTTNQRIRVLAGGTSVGTRPAVNLVQGAGINLSITDDGPNNRVNVQMVSVPDTSIQRVRAYVNGASVFAAGRPAFNFSNGPGLTMSVSDDPANNWTAIYLDAGVTAPPVYYVNSTQVSNQVHGLNLVASTNMALSGVESLANDRVNVTFIANMGCYVNGVRPPSVRPNLNFVAVGDTLIDMVDNPGLQSVDIEIRTESDPPAYEINSSLIGAEPTLNLIPGTNITMTGVDTTSEGRVQITINATGGLASYQVNGALVGTRGVLNLIAGTNVGISGVDTGSQVNVTISEIAPSQATYLVNGSPVGQRPQLNLIQGAGAIITGVDNGANGRVDITIAASGGSGGGSQTPWVSDIDAANFVLNSVKRIGIGQVASVVAIPLDITTVATASDATIVINPADATSLMGVALRGIGTEAGFVLASSTFFAPPWRSRASLYSKVDFVIWTASFAADGSGVERIHILASNGNVGIAQAVPAYKLDVTGDINVAAGNTYRIGGVPINTAAPPVTSVFTRTGAVAALAADYSAFYPLLTGSYADPSWVASLAYSKLTGVPAPSSQTPWLTDIDAAGRKLNNAGSIGLGGVASATVGMTIQSTGIFDAINQINGSSSGWGGLNLQNDLGHTLSLRIYGSARPSPDIAVLEISATPLSVRMAGVEKLRFTQTGQLGIGVVPAYPLDVAGDVNISAGSVYRVNGVPLSTGGNQTPWTSDIDGATHTLFNAGKIGVGVTVPLAPLTVVASGSALGGTAFFNSAVLQDQTNYRGLFLGYDTSAVIGVIAAAGQSTSQLAFWTINNTWGERMRITAAGNVGIGTASPTGRLAVQGNISGGAVNIDLQNAAGNAVNNEVRLRFMNYGALVGAPTVAPYISSIETDTPSIGAGDMAFGLWNGSALVERMRITAAGNVGIGLTVPVVPLDVVPSPTNSSIRAGGLELQSYALNNGWYTENTYFNAGWVYRGTGFATALQMYQGNYYFNTAPTGTAGTTASMTIRLAILNNGQVCVNTVTPVTSPGAYALTVASPSLRNICAVSGGSEAGICIQNTATNGRSWSLYSSGGATGLGQGNFTIYDDTATAGRLAITAAGYVGIGTPAPICKLSLGSDLTAHKLALFDNGSVYYGLGVDNAAIRYEAGTSGGHSFYCNAAAVFAMGITPTGMVGIGVGGATHPLQVWAAATSATYQNSTITLQRANASAFAGFHVTGISQGQPMFYVPLNTDDWAIGFDAGTGPAERVRFKFGGQVGIGTPAPTGLCLTLIPASNPTTLATCTQLSIGEGSDNGSYRFNIGMGVVASGNWAGVIQSNPGGPGVLQLNPAGGLVGINMGTVAPSYQLDIFGVCRAQSGFVTGVKGNLFGVAAGAVTGPANTDANIKLYDNGSGNWCGIGASADGSMWFRVGSSGAPAAFMVIAPNQGMGLGGIAAPGYQLQCSLDSAAKPGTNTWLVASDLRTKRNIRPYTMGLETLTRLRPIHYEYNGEADTPDGMEAVGVVAQEAISIIPSCVKSGRGKIAGQVTDVLAVNTGDLTWMMVNAFREIDQRLKALEGDFR